MFWANLRPYRRNGHALLGRPGERHHLRRVHVAARPRGETPPTRARGGVRCNGRSPLITGGSPSPRLSPRRQRETSRAPSGGLRRVGVTRRSAEALRAIPSSCSGSRNSSLSFGIARRSHRLECVGSRRARCDPERSLHPLRNDSNRIRLTNSTDLFTDRAAVEVGAVASAGRDVCARRARFRCGRGAASAFARSASAPARRETWSASLRYGFRSAKRATRDRTARARLELSEDRGDDGGLPGHAAIGVANLLHDLQFVRGKRAVFPGAYVACVAHGIPRGSRHKGTILNTPPRGKISRNKKPGQGVARTLTRSRTPPWTLPGPSSNDRAARRLVNVPRRRGREEPGRAGPLPARPHPLVVVWLPREELCVRGLVHGRHVVIVVAGHGAPRAMGEPRKLENESRPGVGFGVVVLAPSP